VTRKRTASARKKPDYWQVLALSPGADAASLKRCFPPGRPALHPDLNGNDPLPKSAFQVVIEAYAGCSVIRSAAAWGRPARSAAPARQRRH